MPTQREISNWSEERKHSVNPMCDSCWGSSCGGCDCGFRRAPPTMDRHKVNILGNTCWIYKVDILGNIIKE